MLPQSATPSLGPSPQGGGKNSRKHSSPLAGEELVEGGPKSPTRGTSSYDRGPAGRPIKYVTGIGALPRT